MPIITKNEESTFLLLYIRNGYVLDFNDSDFNVFTLSSVGVAIKERYGLSKGKSLKAYLTDSSDEDRTKILISLFHYYEEKMEYEYNKNYEDDILMGWDSRYEERYANIYQKCKGIVSRVEGSSIAVTKVAEDVKTKFSSEYLSKQIDLMVKMQTENPTNAIGMAKELIESCCKTILDEVGIGYTKNDDVPALATKTLGALDLLPSNVQPTDRGADAIKSILGSLRAIPSKLAELRNPFGSGHGKSASFQGLEERHAKLAVGSSLTFVDFVWSTYENSKK